MAPERPLDLVTDDVNGFPSNSDIWFMGLRRKKETDKKEQERRENNGYMGKRREGKTLIKEERNAREKLSYNAYIVDNSAILV